MWTAIYRLKIPVAIYWKHMKLQISLPVEKRLFFKNETTHGIIVCNSQLL